MEEKADHGGTEDTEEHGGKTWKGQRGLPE
jgi:hypothetical protein